MYQDFFGKNDDYLNEFKQKVAEQKIATLEERRAELAHSRNNFLGTIAGVSLACVVGWFVLSPQYQQQNKEIPVIRRPQTSVKIKPDNPGGMEIPNQDKDVYTIVEKKDIDNTVVENLLPVPEQPKLPDIVPEETDINENAENLDEIVEDVSEENNPEKADASAVVAEKPDDLLVENMPKEVEQVKNDTIEAETKKTISAEPTENEPENLRKVANGNWQIQLIASKNKGALEDTWNKLSSQYTILKSFDHEIQSADLGAQGMIYKLRAGNFATKAEAQEVCSALKAKGLNDCIVKER